MNSNYYVDTSYGVSTSSGLTGAIAAMGLFFWILSMALGILEGRKARLGIHRSNI